MFILDWLENMFVHVEFLSAVFCTSRLPPIPALNPEPMQRFLRYSIATGTEVERHGVSLLPAVNYWVLFALEWYSAICINMSYQFLFIFIESTSKDIGLTTLCTHLIFKQIDRKWWERLAVQLQTNIFLLRF